MTATKQAIDAEEDWEVTDKDEVDNAEIQAPWTE